LDDERVAEFELDFDDWLGRGSGGEAAAVLVERLLERPPACESFVVLDGDQGRRLRLRYWLSRWRIPVGQS
jgi:hypothetical protein